MNDAAPRPLEHDQSIASPLDRTREGDREGYTYRRSLERRDTMLALGVAGAVAAAVGAAAFYVARVFLERTPLERPTDRRERAERDATERNAVEREGRGAGEGSARPRHLDGAGARRRTAR